MLRCHIPYKLLTPKARPGAGAKRKDKGFTHSFLSPPRRSAHLRVLRTSNVIGPFEHLGDLEYRRLEPPRVVAHDVELGVHVWLEARSDVHVQALERTQNALDLGSVCKVVHVNAADGCLCRRQVCRRRDLSAAAELTLCRRGSVSKEQLRQKLKYLKELLNDELIDQDDYKQQKTELITFFQAAQ